MPGRTKIYDTFFKSVTAEVVFEALIEGIDLHHWSLVRRGFQDTGEVLWRTRGHEASAVEFTHHGQVRDIEGGALLTVRTRRAVT